MIETLKRAIEQAGHLPPDQQEIVAKQMQRLLNVFQEVEPGHPIFFDEEAWMRHLGMPEEDIAWVMAQPTEPEPDEEYIDADA